MEQTERKPIRIKGYDYSQCGAYFITICTHERRKLLSRLPVGTPLPGCPAEYSLQNNPNPTHTVPVPELLWYGQIADKYIRQLDAFYDHLSVDKYVIMPDHIHFLVMVHNATGHPGSGVPTKN